jgi:hypothetical protein
MIKPRFGLEEKKSVFEAAYKIFFASLSTNSPKTQSRSEETVDGKLCKFPAFLPGVSAVYLLSFRPKPSTTVNKRLDPMPTVDERSEAIERLERKHPSLVTRTGAVKVVRGHVDL